MIRLFGVCALLTASAIVFGQTGEEKKKRQRPDAEAEFKKLDKDGDGKLTKAEYEARFEKVGEKGAKFKEAALKRFDEKAGKEGSLSLEQYKKFRAEAGGFGRFAAEAIFKKLDKDGNGKLTKAEYEAMFEKVGEKGAKFKEAALKRFDEAAGNEGELTLDQFKKLQQFPGKGKGKRKKKADL